VVSPERGLSLELQIREATLDDLDKYIELSEEFHKASPMSSVSKFEKDAFKDFLISAIDNQNIVLVLAEINKEIVGITGALIYPLYFSPSTTVSQELWWWLTPSARGSGAGKGMYDYIEKWAKSNGAKAVFMIALEDEKVNKMTKLYSRLGYKGLERTFIKEI
jgi:RimJ/RimL family protein N-acetyltransferase